MKYETAEPKSRGGIVVGEKLLKEIIAECEKRNTKSVSVSKDEFLKEINSTSKGPSNSIAWGLNQRFKKAGINLKAGTADKGARLKFTIHKWGK